MTLRQDLSRQPVIVIAVASIDETVAAVEQAGGSVVQAKIAMGNNAHYARVIDSEGNVIGLWE
jgi:hypothetical protein